MIKDDCLGVELNGTLFISAEVLVHVHITAHKLHPEITKWNRKLYSRVSISTVLFFLFFTIKVL
jgi:hypothetical protein